MILFIFRNCFHFIQLYEKVKEKIFALEKSLKEIKTLKELLPICSYCKSIRIDENYWQKLDFVILEEKFEKSFDYLLPKLILTENESFNLEKIKDIIKYFNKYYDSILYSLPSEALIINDRGIILKANKKFFKLFQNEKIIGKNINYFIL